MFKGYLRKVKMRLERMSLLVLILLIAGCNAPISIQEQPSMVPVISSPDENGEITESPSTTAMQIPTALSCPVPLGAPPLPALDVPSSWATDILNYLNQGGSLTAFLEALPTMGQDDPQGLSGNLKDLNGDGYDDLITSLFNPSEVGRAGESVLLVFLCDEDQFRLAHALSSMPEAKRVHLFDVIDLTGDGLSEILAMQEICGAHTCSQAWEILQWQNDRFVNVLAGRSDDLPSPTFEISGPKPDGSMIINITGSGVQSVGAGPNRPLTRVWHWIDSDSIFMVMEERLASPYFRIHALHDADLAALDGEYENALSDYQRVIEDPTLDDYPYGEQGRAQLSAYALYRSMLVWLLKGDLTKAEETHNFLQEAYPDPVLGSKYSSLAREFWDPYQSGAGLDRACRIAQAYALEHPADILEPLYYGYANKQYLAFDICPFTQ